MMELYNGQDLIFVPAKKPSELNKLMKLVLSDLYDLDPNDNGLFGYVHNRYFLAFEKKYFKIFVERYIDEQTNKRVPNERTLTLLKKVLEVRGVEIACADLETKTVLFENGERLNAADIQLIDVKPNPFNQTP